MAIKKYTHIEKKPKHSEDNMDSLILKWQYTNVAMQMVATLSEDNIVGSEVQQPLPKKVACHEEAWL